MQLTVEELKALEIGDWVWVIDFATKSGCYKQINDICEEEDWIWFEEDCGASHFPDYGKEWIAYKNKEQAERSLPDVEKKCCANCRNKGFAENKCDKLTKLFEENGLQYEQDLYSSNNDKWIKRHDLMEDNCCDDFESRWLEYPIAVAETTVSQPTYNTGLGHKVGQLVKIRPYGKEYGDKTYLGLYLGDLPISIHQGFNSETHILNIFTHNNPAIFIPQIGKIVFGCESWWGEIDNPDELKDITDECINSQWYVKALQELNKKD